MLWNIFIFYALNYPIAKEYSEESSRRKPIQIVRTFAKYGKHLLHEDGMMQFVRNVKLGGVVKK